MVVMLGWRSGNSTDAVSSRVYAADGLPARDYTICFFTTSSRVRRSGALPRPLVQYCPCSSFCAPKVFRYGLKGANESQQLWHSAPPGMDFGVDALRSVIQQLPVALFRVSEICRARDKVPCKTSVHLSRDRTSRAKYCFQQISLFCKT
jgi:hypothetical protein